MAKYSTNINVQLLIALLKAHGIKKVIVSPGYTHVEFVGSIQCDPWFEIYSCVDERGSAYLACGLAAESGEPVVITCTEATASRNYFPGLTEAFYRKLPVLAVTGLHAYSLIGHLEPQVIDRSVSPKDLVKLKVELPVIQSEADIWESELKINQALLELRRNGGGPVHINLPRIPEPEQYSFSVDTLYKAKAIFRYTRKDSFPRMDAQKIAIIVGAHARFTQKELKAVEAFCQKHNAVVFCDLASAYHGDYAVNISLISTQKKENAVFSPDLIIHIGEGSGDYNTMHKFTRRAPVWRVSEDGEIRDPFRSIEKVFEMEETVFFEHYTDSSKPESDHSYYNLCLQELKRVRALIPALPFSILYAASEASGKFPEKSEVHFGMSNTLRAWTLFDLPKNVESIANVGCRGIDGTLSSLIGASFANKEKLFFGVLGDLSFFYDLNSLGNRYIRPNLRIMVINNNGGSLFKKKSGASVKWFSMEEIDAYISAADHFGGANSSTIKQYVEAMGYEYLSASNKEEFDSNIDRFLSPALTDKPMIFELITTNDNEAEAFHIMETLEREHVEVLKEQAKKILGREGTQFVKKILKK